MNKPKITHIETLRGIAIFLVVIYLFHGFGTSGGRIILTRLGMQSDILIFVVATCIALFSPILVEKIADRWKVTRILFTGSK